MGRTMAAWQSKVSQLLANRGERDIDNPTLESVGIRPAFAQFSVDRPHESVVESAGSGSAYVALPAGWIDGLSALRAVEYPARRNPPATLDAASWAIVRDPDDVSVRKLLLNRSTLASQWVRLTFTGPWPVPTSDPDDDVLNDVAFEAVAALAASFCCVHLQAEAARSRAGALASDFSDGRERAQRLNEAAKAYRSLYEAFLGMGKALDAEGGQQGGGGSAPAWGSYDLDPQFDSLFHGGRA